MFYSQNLKGCSVPQADLKSLFESSALNIFKDSYQKGQLAPLSLVEQTDDIKSFQSVAHRFEKFEDILILGTGGSSLGGQAITALSSQNLPRLHFYDNIDPHTFSKLFSKLNIRKTGILAISKSGFTVETLMQVLTCVQHFKNDVQKDQFIVITEPTDNPLRRLATENDWLCLDHPTNVGGRYSCFSIVGLIPLILAGLDPYAFRKGAQSVLHQHLNEELPPAFEAAATAIYLANHKGKNLSVMLPYSDQLNLFSSWYCQLWAESLGKEGKGTSPIRALGTVDQHSQLQLYLGGPKDKFFTVISPSWKGQGEKIQGTFLPDFQGKTMGDLLEAECKATYTTLINNDCPTRLLSLEKINESSLGALMMHFMIETILASYLMKVNAFDQPAVEARKQLAREYLAA